MPTKQKDMVYVGFWISKEELDMLDKLVEYFRKTDPWARASRSAVIRKLINDAYSTLLSK